VGLRAPSELELPIGHALASFGKLEEITVVISKDEALAQCSRIINERGRGRLSAIPGSRATLSTTGAARHVAGKRAPSIAAICGEPAARFHGVPMAQRNVAGSPGKAALCARVRAD